MKTKTNNAIKAVSKITIAQWLCLIVGTMVIGVVVALNMQPWLHLGDIVAPKITRGIPGASFFFSISLFGIGNALKTVTSSVPGLIGFGTWALCQGIQFMPWYYTIKKEPVGKDLWVLARRLYIVELVVCFIHYPPYGEGFPDFIADVFRWDFYLINWHEIINMIVTVFAFEAIVSLFVFLFMIEQNRVSKKTSKASRQHKYQDNAKSWGSYDAS